MVHLGLGTAQVPARPTQFVFEQLHSLVSGIETLGCLGIGEMLDDHETIRLPNTT